MSAPRWLRFGRWPSTHDLDLILDAADCAGFEDLAGPFDYAETQHAIPVAELPLPPGLLAVAVDAAGGLPLDLFLSPDDWSVAAWVAPPYEVAEVGWRPTLDLWFFDGAVPLGQAATAAGQGGQP